MDANEQESAFRDFIPHVRLAADKVEIPQELTAKLVAALAALGIVIGKVTEIVTTKSGKHKKVKGRNGKTEIFFFPPNDEKFDKELERAQNNDLEVEVLFEKREGEDIISSVTVYGKKEEE